MIVSGSPVKPSVASDMALARMAASGASSLIVIDEVTHEGGKRMNSDV